MRFSFGSLNKNLRCSLLIFFCFFLSSGVYLSWVYHLMDMAEASAVDLLSMVAGYLCQAVGVGAFAAAERRRPGLMSRAVYVASAALLVIFCVPAVRSRFLAGVFVFGFLMNLFIGVMAGFYLRALAVCAERGRRGLVFGGGYAAATVAAWLFSLIGGGGFLRSGYILIVYAALTVLSVPFVGGEGPRKAGEAPTRDEGRRTLALAAVTVFLLSLVKNIGFGFPTADLMEGVKLELSRVLYAVGLVAAGLISDRSRKYGAICALAALMIPFIMLALAGEPISATVFWALDYLFYGFFSVFRVVFFSDLAEKTGALPLAGLGLMFGRLGDAAGTGVNLLFSGQPVVLVLATALFFALTVFFFFRLYQSAYAPGAVREKSARELFEQFSARYDLSPRERAVLRLVTEERSNAEIAEALFVSESTVKFHIHNILKKTDCKNRVMLIAKLGAPDGDAPDVQMTE